MRKTIIKNKFTGFVSDLTSLFEMDTLDIQQSNSITYSFTKLVELTDLESYPLLCENLIKSVNSYDLPHFITRCDEERKELSMAIYMWMNDKDSKDKWDHVLFELCDFLYYCSLIYCKSDIELNGLQAVVKAFPGPRYYKYIILASLICSEYSYDDLMYLRECKFRLRCMSLVERRAPLCIKNIE